MSSRYYIGKLEKKENQYIIHKPYDVTGSMYGIIYDFLESVGICIEYDFCYGETDDRFNPIIYKKEEWFYNIADFDDNITNFFECGDRYIYKDNEYISEEDMLKMDDMFNLKYPLRCTKEYIDGVKYCVNERRVNKRNYLNANKISDIEESMNNINIDHINKEEIINIIRDIVHWMQNDNYIYISKYY